MYCMFWVNQQFDPQTFLAPKKGCNLMIEPCYRMNELTPYFVVSSDCCSHCLTFQLFKLVWDKLLNLTCADFLLHKTCLTSPKLMSGNSPIFHKLPEIILGAIQPLIHEKNQKVPQLPLPQARLVIKSSKNGPWNHKFYSMWELERFLQFLNHSSFIIWTWLRLMVLKIVSVDSLPTFLCPKISQSRAQIDFWEELATSQCLLGVLLCYVVYDVLSSCRIILFLFLSNDDTL